MLAPLIFVSFVVLMFFIMLNMILAVVMKTYDEVAAPPARSFHPTSLAAPRTIFPTCIHCSLACHSVHSKSFSTLI